MTALAEPTAIWSANVAEDRSDSDVLQAADLPSSMPTFKLGVTSSTAKVSTVVSRASAAPFSVDSVAQHEVHGRRADS